MYLCHKSVTTIIPAGEEIRLVAPTYQLTPSMPLYALIFCVTLALCVYALVRYLRHDRRSLILAFAVVMAAISSWELGNFLVDAVTAEQLKLLGKNVVNAVSVPLSVYGLVAFSLIYTDNERRTWWVAGACAVTVAGMSVALFLAPELLYESHGLATQSSLTLAGFTFEQFVTLDRTLTPAFSFYWVYSVLLLLGASAILVRYVFQTRRDLVSGQASAVLVGVGAPLGASVLLFTGVVSPAWNPTDLSFGVTAVCFALAVFRYRLFRLVPVGRQQLVRIMNDPVVLIDDENRVVDSNPIARNLFDAGSDWRGSTAATFFDSLAEEVTQSHDTDGVNTEIQVERDGDDRYFNLRTTPVQTPAGEVGGSLIVFHDVTELIKSRQEIQQQNERLDQFTSVVAHDIRNPLSVAMGFLEIAEETGNPDHLEKVISAHDHIERLVEDLLTLARGETTIEDADEVDLETIATEAWNYVDTDEATLAVSNEVTMVTGDRGRLTQLFENLFRNAIEHGGADVTITVGRLDEGDGFSVEDDGNGIPKERRDEVFQHGVTSIEGGTGFGLSIVADIAKAHGWNVCVTDGSDGGARFEFAGPE